MNKIRKKIQKKINRSGKATCPICNNHEILSEHHLEGRDIPQPNHPSNIANLCSNCHRKIHEGIIIIEGWFNTTNGLELLWHSKKEESFTGKKTTPYIIS